MRENAPLSRKKTISPGDTENARVFLVGGLSRTGGSLIPFLIDGHRGFFGVPFELHLSEAWDGPPPAEFFRAATKDEILKALLKGGLYHRFVLKNGGIRRGLPDLYSRKGISNVDTFDRHSFLTTLGNAIDSRVMNHSNYLYLISRAFISAIGEDPAQTQFIVDHSGRAILTETSEIFAITHIGRYIYTKRPSLDWLASIIKKGARRKPQPDDQRYLISLLLLKHCIDAAAVAYAKKWPYRYHIIEFADAVQRPEVVIRHLHSWAGLPEPERLSPEPTYRGGGVRPNSSFAERNRDRVASSFELWDIPQNVKASLSELQSHLDETDTFIGPTHSHALAWMIRSFRRQPAIETSQQFLSSVFRLSDRSHRTLRKLGA